jgi:uncharacterized protein (DUF885 family)
LGIPHLLAAGPAAKPGLTLDRRRHHPMPLKPRRRFTIGRIILALLLVLLIGGGYWSYRLIWGRPMQIDHFYERVFIAFMLDRPQTLSEIGIIDNTWLDFHSGKLDDASPDVTERDVKRIADDLEILHQYDPADETPNQRLSTAILDWFLDNEARGAPYRYHDYPVNQLFGVQSEEPDFMVHIHRVIDERSARRYVERLNGFGRYFDQIIEGLKLRESKGVVPPKFVVTKVLAQMRGFTGTTVQENLLYTNFAEKLDQLKELDPKVKADLLASASQAIETQVYPAYARLTEYETGLEPRARTTDGVWALPDGDAYYAWKLRSETTSDMTPAEVHQFGLDEVKRIQAEIVPILDGIGAPPGPVGARIAALQADPQYLYPNNDDGRAQMLARYRTLLDEMGAALPKYFALLPKGKLEVEAVPAFKAATAPGAYYQGGSLDGGREGTFFANVANTAATPRWAMKTLAYHEGVPGHHLQISLANEMSGVPTFRRILGFTAYAEGWALYSERLAWELGFELDPLDNLGRLQAELFRATRLVVDTGIHYQRWTREQAIQYMLETTGMEEGDVTAEIERYIVNPGQACAYKIGLAKILELRDAAKTALGDRFDLKEFHRAVLQDGGLPLSILDQRVREWIGRVKAGATGTSVSMQ